MDFCVDGSKLKGLQYNGFQGWRNGWIQWRCLNGWNKFQAQLHLHFSFLWMQHLPCTVLYTGVIILPPQTRHLRGKSPKNLHIFALFDPFKMIKSIPGIVPSFFMGFLKTFGGNPPKNVVFHGDVSAFPTFLLLKIGYRFFHGFGKRKSCFCWESSQKGKRLRWPFHNPLFLLMYDVIKFPPKRDKRKIWKISWKFPSFLSLSIHVETTLFGSPVLSKSHRPHSDIFATKCPVVVSPSDEVVAGNRWNPICRNRRIVHGKEIRWSPVEVGGLSHYLQGFMHFSGVFLAGFLKHQPNFGVQSWPIKLLQEM